MNLKERLDSLPASKTLKIIEFFFNEYNVVYNLKTKPTLARFGEADYIRLINRKLSDVALERELKKMVKLTQFRVMSIFIDVAGSLSKLSGLVGDKI